MDEIEAFYGNWILLVENTEIYSVWILLEKIVAKNQSIFYLGGMNPENLVMAQKLLTRFGMDLKTHHKSKNKKF